MTRHYPMYVVDRAVQLSATFSSAQVVKRLQKEFPKLSELSEKNEFTLDPRTVRRWKQEAKLKESRKQQPTSYYGLRIPRQHFAQLTNIAYALLNRIDKIEKASPESKGIDYILWYGGTSKEVSKDQLKTMLNFSLDKAKNKFGKWDVVAFAAHLLAEFNHLDCKSINDFIAVYPYEYVETLWTLSRRGEFKGTCRICK